MLNKNEEKKQACGGDYKQLKIRRNKEETKYKATWVLWHGVNENAKNKECQNTNSHC